MDLEEFKNSPGINVRTKFNASRMLQFSINGIQMKFTEKFFLGKGLYKKAFEVTILSGEHAGKQAALLVGHRDRTQEEFDWKMKIQSFAGEKGITNKVYTWNFHTLFGPVSVVELISGKDLCDLDITEEQQLQLLTFILKMVNIGILQADPNCANFIYQDDHTWITIDDILFLIPIPKNVEYNTIGTSIPPLIKLYKGIEMLKYLQNLQSKPLKRYALQWIRENVVEDDENPKEDEITKIRIEPKLPEYTDFYDKVNTIVIDFVSKSAAAGAAAAGGADDEAGAAAQAGGKRSRSKRKPTRRSIKYKHPTKKIKRSK